MSSRYCPVCWTGADARAPACASCGFEAPAAAWPSAALAGRALQNGKYRLLRPLGAGGFGSVALAQQFVSGTSLGSVAIKFPFRAADASGVERFLDEAAALRRAPHPNIVALHDAFVDDGVPYLVTEYVRGGAVLRHFTGDHRMGLREVLETAIQISDAVDSMHVKGALHCDLKPSNVAVLPWLSGTRHLVKVLDFGIACLWRPGVGWSGRSVGTPGFVAPEQVDGGPRPQSDVFSLGVLLYWLLSGGLPYPAALTLQPGALRAAAPPAPLVDVPPELDELIGRCLRPDPEQRFPRMPGRVLLDLLEGAVAAGVVAEVDVAGLLRQAKETFLSAGLSPSPAQKARLYRRSADLFDRAAELTRLSPRLAAMAEKARRFAASATS